MHLYNLTLHKPTAVYSLACGNFSGTKVQEIALGKSRYIELYRPDASTGKLILLKSVDVYGLIRSLLAFRLPGTPKDYIIVGTDSGAITVLEYNPKKNILERIHLEVFGKTGCRRIVPGQYLTMDPKGRAVMIGAVEKQKFVYILNRDSDSNLTISSPLEAHKAHTLLVDMVGMDVGFENPLFCCLEFDYEDADNGDLAESNQQLLTYYELDLGLNHVVRKSTEVLDFFANKLIPIPGGADGPGGVIVCGENFFVYKNINDDSEDQPPIKCPIPKRKDDLDTPDRTNIIVATCSHRTKNLFFFLVQTDQGDIFKLSLNYDKKSDRPVQLIVKYFDTLPYVASHMCILRTGFLFVASEFSDHQFYQVIKLGDNLDEPEFSSAVYNQNEAMFYFQTRDLLNLMLVDQLPSFAPIMDSNVVDLFNEDSPQLYMTTGRSNISKFSVLRYGVQAIEMAVSELPGDPTAVWSLKTSIDSPYDAFIVVSFINATLVLSIGEVVEEISDSGFLTTTNTLACSVFGENSSIQIYPKGIRHIKADRRVDEWHCPSDKEIKNCTINHRQIVIILTGEELVYFELDQTGTLSEYTERKILPEPVICITLSPIPAEERRARFLAMAMGDNTIRIVSLDPKDCLSPLSMQALPELAHSMVIIETARHQVTDDDDEAIIYDADYNIGLFLYIGLENGVLLKTMIEPNSGEIADSRTRYLGNKSVKLFKTTINNSAAVMAISARNYLSYYSHNRFNLIPVSYDRLDFVTPFSSEQCPEGIIAIVKNTMRILVIEKVGTSNFNQQSVDLKYTPRKMILENSTKCFVIIETDHNTFTTKETQEIKESMISEMRDFVKTNPHSDITEETIQRFIESSDNTISSKAGPGTWASILRVINPQTMKTVFLYEFDQDEAACSLHITSFNRTGNDVQYVVVGVSKQLQLNPRHCSAGFIYCFKLIFDRKTGNFIKLDLVHKTPTDEAPTALAGFQGRLITGIGRLLRIYDFGKQKLLKKCEYRKIPLLIRAITVYGPRIMVEDVNESFHFLRYKQNENIMVCYCDDACPRFLTTSCILDWMTIISADKFGNICVNRFPDEVKEDMEEDPTGVKSLWDKGFLNGAPQKLTNLVNYFLGETVNSLQKVSLIPGGPESVMYTTLSGAIGLMIPLQSNEDVEFLRHLEMYMRQEAPPLCGRDHLMFRSFYWPCKNTIDGDLCEDFNNISVHKRRIIAEELDYTPAEVFKKLEEIRNKFAF